MVDEVLLQLTDLIWRDQTVRQRPEARGDAVDVARFSDCRFAARTCRRKPPPRGIGNDDRARAINNRFRGFKAQPAVKRDWRGVSMAHRPLRPCVREPISAGSLTAA